MGRDDGFSVADVSVGYLDDDKVRALWRRLSPNVGAMCEALMLHQATLLASWKAGRRVPVDEAAPLWLLPTDERVEDLRAVGLLDRSRKIPAKSWSGWFEPASTRREARRESGRAGGLARGKRTSSDATATPYPTGPTGPALPSVPSVPSPARPSSPRGRSVGGPSSLGEALEGTPLGAEIASRRSS